MSCPPLQTIAHINTFQDYKKVFNLNNAMSDSTQILEVCTVPSLFNQQMSLSGAQVVTAGPHLRLSEGQMRQWLSELGQVAISIGLKKMGAPGCSPVESSNRARLFKRKTDLFLSDYAQALAQKRYVPSDLTHLPVANHAFDLALCFVPVDATVPTITALLSEMRRKATTCRLAFLVDDAQQAPPWLMAVMTQLSTKECRVTFKTRFHDNKQWVLLCADALSCMVE